MEKTRVKRQKKPRGKVQKGRTLAGPGDPPGAIVVSIKQGVARRLLDRLDASRARSKALVLAQANPSETSQLVSTDAPFTERWNAALGCLTDEVALSLLAQVTELLEPRIDQASEERIDSLMSIATARIAELEPTTATEAMLAVQMVGAQLAAMKFLCRSTADGQTTEVADRCVLRSVRLMRLFNEQVETMAKLKGKSGQQRVTVEHVTINDGGQAIVGSVIPGGRVARDEPGR
jgi:hypothetical protein